MLRLSLLCMLAVAATAQANVGRSHFPGSRTTEPGGLREIAIEHEDLRFDLRPIGEQGDAKVSATYHLDNRGTATVTAPLVFVSGAAVAGTIVVTSDGAAIRAESVAKDQPLPPAWRPPLSTPAFDGDGTLGFETDDNHAFAFTLAIPPGRHQLAVTYSATPQRTKTHEGGTLIHQLGYVLAPARDWGSFGTLQVTVEVPPGWRIAASPPLARVGDTLRGTFPALPADTIGLTFRASTSTLHGILQFALPLFALIVLVGGGYLLFAFGRMRGRNPEDLRTLWPVSLPLSLLWAIAIGISGGFTAMRGELALPPGQSGSYGYDGLLGILVAILAAFVAIPAGLVIARIGARPR